jgi:hypothetical protein
MTGEEKSHEVKNQPPLDGRRADVRHDRLGVSRVMVYMYLIPVAGVGLSAAFSPIR